MSEAPLILVIEDDPGVRGLIAGVLTAYGYEVITAADGLEGLVRVQIRRPALVVLDILMPNLQGGRVLSEMRDDPRISGLPVIVVSGHTEAVEVFGDLLGEANVFKKPFDPDALAARVAALVPPNGPGREDA